MLTTFTIEPGTLVIRSEDLRRIEDVETAPGAPSRCMICWYEEDARQFAMATGTATENLARIVAEEAKVIAAYEEMQQRAKGGYPALPVVRGGKVRP